MVKIFISYRRVDSQYVTDSIHDHMIRHFGEQNVFLDVGSIPFGVDFREYLADQISTHDVVLVIIGPDWARIMQERADQDNDFVRIEIENALKQKKLVIPVLVMEAAMPSFRDLPASIADLQWRNSATIRRKPDLEHDCTRLAEGIMQYMASIGKSAPKPTPPQPKPNPATADAVKRLLGKPFDWCEVPAGEFIYGDKSGKNGPKKLTLPGFAIAKYPITYSQFQVFIDAQDGFKEGRWWEGLAQNQSDKPGDQAWKIKDHPRENVSWTDAMAFCRWLSFKLGGEYTIDKLDEWLIRLPTEFEWEKAARGTDGRLYPYGNDFDTKKGNTSESDIGKTTPVTAYPEGASPYGVMDMSGNVWEWCLSDYSNPAPEARKENISSNSVRGLRGGSWRLDALNARAVTRAHNDPSHRDRYDGFRLLRPPQAETQGDDTASPRQAET